MSTEDLVWNQAQWQSFFVDLCRFEQDKGTSLAQKFYNQGIRPTQFNLLVESNERVIREELKQLDILTYGDYTMIWNRRRLEHYLGTDEKVIIWCKENGFLHREMICRKHRI
uniref:Uncharacterized protein n=1 Tax=Acrobeloides nanus TaxID=290746 RepID=A0A914CA84_9BILA